MLFKKLRYKMIGRIADRLLVISKKLFDTIGNDFELAAEFLVLDDEVVEDTRSYEDIIEGMTPLERALFDSVEQAIHKSVSKPTPNADGTYNVGWWIDDIIHEGSVNEDSK